MKFSVVYLILNHDNSGLRYTNSPVVKVITRLVNRFHEPDLKLRVHNAQPNRIAYADNGSYQMKTSSACPMRVY